MYRIFPRSSELLALMLLSFLPGFVFAEDNPSYYPIEEIGSKKGYLLLDLSLARDTGTIHIRRLSIDRKSMIDVFESEKIEIGPYAQGRHMQLLRLPAGVYSLSEIHVPHYNLPYVIDRSNDVRWRFTIKNGRVNYIGQILVTDSPSTEQTSVFLLNRIAATYDDVVLAFSDQISRYPLRHAALHRDRYFETYVDVRPEPDQ